MGDFTRTKLEVFGSEYDDTLYVMPEGMWEGRGGPNTFAVILERTADRDGKARLIAAAPDSHAANLEFVEAIDALYGVTPAWDSDRVYDDLPSTGLAMAYLAARAAIAKATQP